MNKLILRAAFVVLVLFVSAKAFTVLFAFQSIEAFKQEVAQEIAVNYTWLGSDLGGDLLYEDLLVRPYVFKRSATIESVRLRYHSGNDLLKTIAGFEDDSLREVILSGVEIELGGRDIDEWLAEEFHSAFLLPLGVYACGDRQRISHDDLVKMGIDKIRADVSYQFLSDIDGGVRIDADVHELGQLSIQIDGLTGHDQSFAFSSLGSLGFDTLRLTHTEAGYMRRLSNYCQQASGLGREAFAARAALLWQTRLFAAGIEVSSSLVKAYERYIAFGGQLELNLALDPGQTLQSLVRSYDRNLFANERSWISLNDEKIPGASLLLRSQVFDPPPVVEVVAPVAVEPALPEWRQIELASLDEALGYRARLTMLDGKIHEGRVSLVDEFKVILMQQVEKGELAFNLDRIQVSQAELWVAQ